MSKRTKAREERYKNTPLVPKEDKFWASVAGYGSQLRRDAARRCYGVVRWISAPHVGTDINGNYISVYQRMARFGGWQAKWLASVVMLQGQGVTDGDAMVYTRDTDRMIVSASPTGRHSWRSKVEARIYTIGLVDIDELFIELLVPDTRQRDAFIRGDEHEFYAA